MKKDIYQVETFSKHFQIIKCFRAFTLMELLITTILIGLIASFAFPQYGKAIRKAHQRDAVIQLQAIHAAQIIYHSQTREFLPTGTGDLSAINVGLNINVLPNELTYSYARTAVDSYSTVATWDEAGTANDFSITIDQDALSASNPCCSTAGKCPSLPDC